MTFCMTFCIIRISRESTYWYVLGRENLKMENEVRESTSVVPQENAFEPISMDLESMEFDGCKLPI